MSDDRYVQTAAIRQVVQGHEIAVLAALGIDWRPGCGHIDCPYADHGGRSDWRWSERKRRAFCTCIGKRAGEKRSHSLFDVVALKEGIDFEAAKIRVAEIIGRPDLIKTKSSGKRHQTTVAESLLNPPPDNRNDDLVWIYLGSRLGVDPDRVLRPRTRVLGIQALEYFDPPSQKGKKTAKPILVATTPCAVFEQTDRDGNIHAHRIYLAVGGLGKANLGSDANGKPRVPKKSAKIIGDDNTSGRSVLWGDPLTATLAILCEGVETASAVALAFQAEIAAGEILVAACINAAGIENFKPWQGTTEVIVAADRDEAAADGDQLASRRGEHAARTFGIRHHRKFAGEAALPVSIALPGVPGESIDWLDVLRRDGVAAVHSGVLGGAAFAPTAAEIERHRNSATQADRLQEVIETYPLPHMARLRVEFRYTRHDEIWVHKFEAENSKQDTDEKTETWTPIASPMGVPALLQMADENDTYGLRVVVQDMCGKPRTVDFERGELARLVKFGRDCSQRASVLKAKARTSASSF
jgi:Toprim domain